MVDPSKKADVEFQPDAWERFERAVSVVAKSPPQPKAKKSKKQNSKKRKPA
jgi:hypothetical protein